MSFDPERREFIKGAGRLIALGTLIFGGAALVKKPGARNEKCVSDGVCSQCRIVAECGLPQALSAKQGMSRK